MHAVEMIEACATELRERSKLVWQCIQRAHKSCGSKISDDLVVLFRGLLQSETAKVEQVQELVAGPIIRQLQNSSLLPSRRVSDMRDHLLVVYDAEIAMYLDDLKRGTGTTEHDRLKNRFLNNKILAGILVVVLAIVALASFTDALAKLSAFFSSMAQNGKGQVKNLG